MPAQPPIPAELERQLKLEAGFICAMPGCNATKLDLHHIVKWAKCLEHRFENMIALCPYHHSLADNGTINTKALKQLKAEMVQRRYREVRLEGKVGQPGTTASQLLQLDEQRERDKTELRAQLTEASEPQLRKELQARIARLEKAECLFNKGWAAFEHADYRQALKCLEASRELGNTSAVQSNLGTVYWKLVRLDDALEAYYQADQLRQERGLPLDAELARSRGNIYASLRLPYKALAAYDEAEQLRHEQGLPPHPALARNRGAAYWLLGRLDDALAAYDEAERWRTQQGLPPDPDLTLNRGLIYRQLGRLDDALASYDEADQLREQQGLPPDPDSAVNRGVVFEQLNRMDDALAAYNLAERLRHEQGLPPDPDLVMNQGVVCWRLRQLNEALAAYSKAERLRKEQGLVPDPAIFFNRAEILFFQGSISEACRMARDAKRMYEQLDLPVHPQVKAFLAEHCADDQLSLERGRNIEIGLEEE